MRHVPTLLLAIAFPLLLAGCGEKDSEDDTGSSSGDDGSADGTDGGEGEGDDGSAVDCGGAAPVVTDITATNGGLVDVDGAQAPSVLLAITANDPDGDLHEIIADVYMDQEVDGTVATDSSSFDPSVASLDEPPCEVTDVTLNLGLAFPEGTAATLGAPVEFGVYLYDAGGNLSNFFVVEACLPNADGTDGDCGGGSDEGDGGDGTDGEVG